MAGVTRGPGRPRRDTLCWEITGILWHRLDPLHNNEDAWSRLSREEREDIAQKKEWQKVARRAKSHRVPDGWTGTRTQWDGLSAYEQHANKMRLAQNHDAAERRRAADEFRRGGAAVVRGRPRGSRAGSRTYRTNAAIARASVSGAASTIMQQIIAYKERMHATGTGQRAYSQMLLLQRFD